MKKLYILILVFGFGGCVFAQANENADAYPRMTLAEAVEQRDETRMSIEGVFLRQNRGEEDEFVFKDAGGDEIVVYDHQQGRQVRFNVPALVMGAIDRNLLKTEFNLDRVEYGPMPSGQGRQTSIPNKGSPVEADSVAADGLLIHLSSGYDHPNQVAMALTLASAFAGENPVLVYADLKAVALFTKQAGDIAPDGYRSMNDMIPALLEAGVHFRVCPTCLAAADLSSADLRPGIQLADKREFFSFAEGRILTFDY